MQSPTSVPTEDHSKINITSEIDDLISKSMAYQEKINTAKTNLKKELYKKKLKKNNIKLVRVLAFNNSFANNLKTASE